MRKLHNIRLVLADLDGTLLDHKKQITRTTLKTCEKLKQANIEFSIVTGRNYHIVEDFVRELNITIPYVTNNGANIFINDRCMYECSIDKTDYENIRTLLLREGIAFVAYANQTVYVVGKHPSLDTFIVRLKEKCSIVYTETAIVQQEIFKIVLVHNDATYMMHIMEAIHSLCKQTHCVRSEGEVYTITNENATKGIAVKQMMHMLAISPEETIAFGDNYNDISMFEVVEYDVCMGNALPQVKQQASYHTKRNDEDGVAYFLETYVL